MTVSKVKFGVVGCGFIGSTHLKSFKSIEKGEVVAVCDIIEERAKKAAEEYKVPKVYTDFYKLLEDKEIDAVIIGTPPYLHKEQAIGALKAGKHVFLEKPIAISLKDAIEVRNTVKKTGLKLMLGLCLRYHGLFSYAKNLVSELGKPVKLWHVALGRVPTYADWIKYKEKSGGMICENGVHILDFYRWVAGPVKKVYAELTRSQEGITIEDNATVVLYHENGAVSTLVQSWASTHPYRSWGIVYRNGNLSIQGYLDGLIKLSKRDGTREEKEHKEDVQLMYIKEMKHFIECILKDKTPSVNEDEGVETQKIIEAVYLSSKKKEPIDMSSI